MEIPGLNGLMSDFETLDTQVLGVSVDSKFSHKAWSVGFGGIKYPLLADFHPKGEVAKAYGVWLDGPGIGDRATVLIGKDGKVLFSESVTPSGCRIPGALLEETRRQVS